MCRMHFDAFLCQCIHPTTKNSPARENKDMWPVAINNGEFEIAVEWRARNRFPHR